MPNMTYTMQFRADTSSAKKELETLQKQLKDLAENKNITTSINRGITKEIQEASRAAATLQSALQKATNASTGQLDLRVFNSTIERSGNSIEDLGKKLTNIGGDGRLAFANLTDQIIKAEEPIRQTSKMMDSLFRTMANSVKWQLSATAVYGIMDAISGAYQYAVDLDTSLNNIRIVSGQSAEQMAQFAEYANQAAKSLSTTTVDYSDAALIYYQQGLSEQEVKNRTDLTIKMANVTGDTVQDVSNQLTSVWNNFYDGSRSLEYYIDVMTELGAATASSSSEIADGLQDFAAIAGMIGLDFDRAATMIATTASVSRQSADVIGTSFRSIFSRIQGLQMGETLEDGVDLNKYSTALQKVGIDVLDASGNLRDMNGILDEMGAKWQELSQTEQTALAQTVAGVWQYNNLVTLMDNWDTFEENLSIAQNSAGTLEEQSQIYEESWVAASNRVKAALEDVYNSILDSDAFKNLLDGIADVITGFDTFIDSIGGLPGALALIGAVGTKVFHDQLASGVRFAGDTLLQLTGLTGEYYKILQQQTANTLMDSIDNSYPLMGNKAQGEILKEQIRLQSVYNDKVKELSEFERQVLDIQMESTNNLAKKYQEAADNQDEIFATFENTRSAILNSSIYSDSDKEILSGLTDETVGQASRRVDEVIKNINRLTDKNLYNTDNIQDFRAELEKLFRDTEIDLTTGLGYGENPISRQFTNELNKILKDTSLTIDQTQKKLINLVNNGTISVNEYYKHAADSIESILQKYSSSGRMSPNDIKNSKELVSILRELGSAAQTTNDRGRALKVTVDAMIEAMSRGSQDVFFKASSGVVAFGNALANATLAITTMQSAWNTLNNEDASFFDKALSSILALSVAIPSLIELMNAIKLMREANVLAVITQLATSTAHVAALKAETAATKDSTQEIKENTAERGKNVASTAAQTITETAGDVLDGADGKNNQKRSIRERLSRKNLADNAKRLAEIGTLGSSIKSLFSSLGSMLGTIISTVSRFAGVIGIAVGAFYLLKQAAEAFYASVLRDDDAYNLEQTTEAAQNLAAAYNETKAAQDELTSNIEGYYDNLNAIESLTKGTQEYAQAILDANDAAIQLIQSSDEIGANDWSIGEDGIIEIDESAIERATQAQLEDLIREQSAMQMTNQRMSELQTTNDINELVDELGQSARTVLNAAIENPTVTDEASSIAELLGLSEDSPIVQEIYNAREDINSLAKAVNEDTTSRENTAQSVAEQILSANEMEATSRSGQMYNRLYQDAYDSAIETLSDVDSYNQNQVAQDLMRQLGIFTDDEIASATYDRYDQTLTYDRLNDEGQLEPYTITDEELANLIAASDAQEDLIDATSRLTSRIDELKNSADETDRSIAGFLENGNLENLTKYEYEAIRNMSDADQRRALGLTGNTEHDNQIAQDAGYEDADAYLEAFNKALEIEWEIPEGLGDQLAEALTVGSMQIINNNLRSMGEESGKQYIDGLNNFFNSVDFSQFGDDAYNQQVDFMNVIGSIDWSDSFNGIRTLKDNLSDFGVELDLTNPKVQDFLDSVTSADDNFPDFSTIAQQMANVQEITQDLNLGDIISKDDYQSIVAYNNELAKYFMILADGTAMLVGDPLDFQQELTQSYIDDLLAYSQSVKLIQNDLIDRTQILSSFEDNDPTISAATAVAETQEELTKLQHNWIDSQLNLLETNDEFVASNEEQIESWRKLNDAGVMLPETMDKVAEAVDEVGFSYEETANRIDEAQQIMLGAQFQAAMNMSSDQIKEYLDSNQLMSQAANAALYAQMEQEQWDGIDTEEVENLAQYYREIADESDIFSNSLANNEEASEDLALAVIRMNKGMDSLVENFEDWNDVLQNSSKESLEYAEAITEMGDALSDVLNVSSDLIRSDFIENNLDLIRQAAQGSEEAIQSLRENLSKDIVAQVVGVSDFSQVDSDIQNLYNQVLEASNNLNVEVGASIDDSGFINALNNLINATGMTTDEVQGMLSSMGYEPVFDEATATYPVQAYRTETQYYDAGLYETSMQIPKIGAILGQLTGIGSGLSGSDAYETVTMTLPRIGQETYTSPIDAGTYEMSIPAWREQGSTRNSNAVNSKKNMSATKTSGSNKTSLKGATANVKSVNKVSSPSWSGSNYSPANAGGSAPYSPSGSGGGGGGSSDSGSEDEPTPAELMEYTQITEVVDRYYEITDSIDDMTDALEDASDAADRLYGKDRIAAMEQQRDLMAQQQELLKQYRSEIEAYLAKDKAALENNKYGIHFTFDADGDITNYTQIMTDLWNQLHAAEQTYNSFATKEEQDAYQESTLDPLNKKIEEIKNLIDIYDSTQDLLVDVDNQIRDALNEWQDKNYEILTYKIELQIEINDMEQERLDYYLNKYEDDFYKMAESMALTGDSFPLLTNNLETYKNEMNQLNQSYHNGEISQDAFIEGMKEVNSGLLDNMNALVDLDREMLEYYENTLDSAEDKLGDFTDQLEHQMSILEHYQNVLSLIGKEQDYQMIGSVLQGQFSVAQDQLAAQERWVETLKNQMADIQSDLLSAVDEKEREALNEQLLLVTQRLNEAEESVNDLRESVLELAQSILENDLANYAQQLSENLVEGLGFGNLDEYLDTIDKLNTSQEEYLTTTNKVYETNKLIRQAQEDMAENDSFLAKQRYQEYIDYVEQLQEQGRLSEYELKIAQARYEVLQAQIALEEAQNAKDSMRLVRDSQGNYNYVYTANQDNISQAQQALEDAENNLYNIGLEGAQNYQDKYAQILEEAFNAFKDLSEQYKNGEITSEEDFNQKRLELQNYYYNRLKDIQDLYYIAHDLLVNESYTNEADYIFAGIGNLEDFKDATDQYLQDCNNAFDKWQENTDVATDSVGNGLGDLQDHIQDVTDTSSDLTDQIQDDLIPTLEDELEAVRDMTNLWLSHRDALYETLQAYEELQQGAQNTISNAAGVQPGGVLPNIPEEYRADIGAIMAAYLQQGGSVNDDLFQQLWNKRNEKVEWLAAHGYSSDYWGSYGEETIKGFEELVSGGGDQDWYDYAANMYTIEQIREFLKQMGLPAFKSGGYTGEWGPSGRLAIIHEKELILNQDDTNSLINIIREYGKLKSTNTDILSLSFNDIISKFKSIINKINLNDQNQVAAQQVSIEASFPNVSVASEIEDAFNDLLNRAAQYASLNRTNY